MKVISKIKSFSNMCCKFSRVMEGRLVRKYSNIPPRKVVIAYKCFLVLLSIFIATFVYVFSSALTAILIVLFLLFYGKIGDGWAGRRKADWELPPGYKGSYKDANWKKGFGRYDDE